MRWWNNKSNGVIYRPVLNDMGAQRTTKQDCRHLAVAEKHLPIPARAT